MLHRYRLHPLTGVGLAAPMLGFLSTQAQPAPPAFAAISQFHGVNWADLDDNFITGPNIAVGLSGSDSHSTTHAKATIPKGLQSFGANTVRFGINPATTSSSWWNSYTAAFDAATALSMNVLICPGCRTGRSATRPPSTRWEAANGQLVNPASGKCLDDPGFNTANGTQLDLWTCNGGSNQRWTGP